MLRILHLNNLYVKIVSSMVDTLDITTKLEIIGLTGEEIQLFLLMSATIRPYNMTELALRSGIPRTTVYRLCENIAKKGLAEWVIGVRSKKIQPISPSNYDQIIRTKKSELSTVVDAVTSLKKLLKPQQILPMTQVRYYTGKEGMKQLIWNTLKAKNEMVGYSVYGRTKIVGEKFNNDFVIEFNKKKLRDRTIINENILPDVIEKFKIAHQQEIPDIRFIGDKDYFISGDTYIYNNVYAVNFWHGDEVIGVEIENPEIAKVQKGIFEVLWKIAKPLKKELVHYKQR